MNDERFEKLEKSVEVLRERIEDFGRTVGDKVEGKVGELNRKHNRINKDGLFWGLAFIVAGTVWLGKSIGWFYFNIPIAPTALIIIGLYIVLSGNKRSGNS